MQVMINGKTYVPQDTMQCKVGIAITTHNRQDVLNKSLQHHFDYLPSNALIVVIDDGSTTPAIVPDWCKLIRHNKPKGIVAAKNKCLEYLMLSGCEHLFLFDDDAYPITPDWHRPYIDSDEPLLSYIFSHWANGKAVGDARIIGGDGQHVAYSHTRGCMLYLHKDTVNKIGGFDPIFGKAMEQDIEYVDRAFHAGLTSWRYADVVNSHLLIDSLDRQQNVVSSLNQTLRSENLSRNQQVVRERKACRFSAYVDFYSRTPHVLTSYLTNGEDPQRGSKWSNNLASVEPLVQSSKYPVTILTDSVSTNSSATIEKVVPDRDLSVYMQRWRIQWQWLRNHPEVTELWCTDATDVQMLNEPIIEPGKLYVGWESQLTNSDWMVKNHKAPAIAEFLQSGLQLLNCGVVGGDRRIMMEFLHAMVVELDCQHSESPSDLVEMGAFNKVVYTQFANRFVTGTKVTTLFKKNETSGVSWWKHK